MLYIYICVYIKQICSKSLLGIWLTSFNFQIYLHKKKWNKSNNHITQLKTEKKTINSKLCCYLSFSSFYLFPPRFDCADARNGSTRNGRNDTRSSSNVADDAATFSVISWGDALSGAPCASSSTDHLSMNTEKRKQKDTQVWTFILFCFVDVLLILNEKSKNTINKWIAMKLCYNP